MFNFHLVFGLVGPLYLYLRVAATRMECVLLSHMQYSYSASFLYFILALTNMHVASYYFAYWLLSCLLIKILPTLLYFYWLPLPVTDTERLEVYSWLVGYL